MNTSTFRSILTPELKPELTIPATAAVKSHEFIFEKLLHSDELASSTLFNIEELNLLSKKDDLLSGKKIAILGGGSFGLTSALAFSEAGAEVTILSSSQVPTTMTRAIGIIEPQGKDVEPFFHLSIPYFEELVRIGAPIRKDKIIYLYPDQVDQDLIEELKSMPNSNYIEETTNNSQFPNQISFDGYIMQGAAMYRYLTNILDSRGVKFEDRKIETITPQSGYDLTIAALGLGRQAMGDVNIPGNRGQVIYVEGEPVKQLIDNHSLFAKIGSIGIPNTKGSVNIVFHYKDPHNRQEPFLYIGATKKPGSSEGIPTKNDHEFLLEGVKKLWPELHQTITDSNFHIESNAIPYVCVRPGGGDPFSISMTNGCIDIRAGGGMGNTLAPAVGLKALAMGLNQLKK